MFFPESFYIPTSRDYIDEVKHGINKAKETSILFCGCVKNCEKELSRNLLRLNLIKNFFKKCDVFLYENNSRDKTKEVAKQADFCISEHLDVTPHVKDKSLKRRNIMAYARNKYLEFARTKKYDLLAIVDMDLPGGFSLEGILHTVGLDFNKKIYGSNSIVYQDNKRLFFDTWAYRAYESDKEGENDLVFNRGSFPVRVDSCFGGLAIYPYSTVDQDIEYKNYDCDHVTLHNQLRSLDYKIYLNPSMITLYTESYYDKCNSAI